MTTAGRALTVPGTSRYQRWVALVMSILGAVAGGGLILFASVTDHWLEVVSPFETYFRGLTRRCNAGDTAPCAEIPLSDTNQQNVCILSGAEIMNRTNLTSFGTYTALGFIGFCLLLLGIGTRLPAANVGAIIALALATASAFITIAFFYDSMQTYYFCGVPYCDWVQQVRKANSASLFGANGGACYQHYGYSFGAMGTGGAVLVFTAAWTVLTTVLTYRVHAEQEKSDTGPSGKSARPATTYPVSGGGSEEVPVPNPLAPEDPSSLGAAATTSDAIPDGYAWEERSQMYYRPSTDPTDPNDADGTYWDHQTGRYFSVARAQWYDPVSDTWSDG